jgi:U3 small nucleolar RNA-associated protein 10
MNHALLMLTRSSAPVVRLASLQIELALFEELGQQYLALLPETIPFIHEAMEDAQVEVEQACQQLIKLIETLTGESMESYLQ